MPQNILRIGESADGDKKVYILQAIYKLIHRFTANKTKDESGGFLIGNSVDEFGKTNIIISGFIEAKYCEATPTTIKFTHETWEYCHKQIKQKYNGQKIIGWIHTHPDMGIFLSEYDKFIHENFFKEDFNVAYVIDPVKKDEGFYVWQGVSLEQCKGFYIYDEQGKNINIKVDNSETIPASSKGLRYFQNAVISLLIIIAMIFGVVINDLKNDIELLEKQQITIVDSANQSLSYLQEQIFALQDQINKNSNLESKETTTSESNTNDSENNVAN